MTFKDESIRFKWEVDATATRLVRGGMAPWPAVIEAVKIVTKRREKEEVSDE